MGTGTIGTNAIPYAGKECSEEGCHDDPAPGASYCYEHGGRP